MSHQRIARPTSAPSFLPYAVLAASLVALSGGSMMIKAAEAPATVIAAWRVTVAAAVVLPYLVSAKREELSRLRPKPVLMTVATGLLLALHFQLWTASLKLTSVADSVMLANTSPIWIALIGVLTGTSRLTRLTVVSIVACMAGGLLVSWHGLAVGGETLAGNLMATAAGLALAGYLMLGAKALRHLSTPLYMGLTYSCAGVALASTALSTGESLFGYGSTTYLLLVLLGLASQLVGHGGPSWALRTLTPGFVGLFLLADLVVSPVLALVLFRETLDVTTVAGCIVIAAGLVAAASEAVVRP